MFISVNSLWRDAGERRYARDEGLASSDPTPPEGKTVSPAKKSSRVFCAPSHILMASFVRDTGEATNQFLREDERVGAEV